MTSTRVDGKQKVSVATSSTRTASPVDPHQRGVASQMMDEVDLRLPMLSVNGRRKFFHGLAVVMFVPGILIDVSWPSSRTKLS